MAERGLETPEVNVRLVPPTPVDATDTDRHDDGKTGEPEVTISGGAGCAVPVPSGVDRWINYRNNYERWVRNQVAALTLLMRQNETDV